MIDFRNVNTIWASVLVETLHRLGLETAVICPGSRSTPLAVAFASHPQIKAIAILDERSAAFFALGQAKRTGLPVVLVCTSGTAGANFYPAVIEARESHVPLIILTADRPPELRNCRAGQAIDQVKLYGDYPNWYSELAIPEANLGMLRYLRQNIVLAWERSLFPVSGVVHLNLPFREPLAPTIQSEIQQLKSEFVAAEFFEAIFCPQASLPHSLPLERSSLSIPIDQWRSQPAGIIIAGLAQPQDPELYCLAIAKLSRLCSFPVLAEALSPLRNYAALNPYLISTYDLILRRETLARKLTPEIVIQIGELPTSKQLRSWLERNCARRWIIDPSTENFDPLHGKTTRLYTSIEQVVNSIDKNLQNLPTSNYCQAWCEIETFTRQKIHRAMKSLDNLYEGKAAWLISQSLPQQTPIFLANSMSVRYAEFFWQPNNRQIVPIFSRGANGIDGTLSTALGVAHGDRSAVLLTGDLALLHDTNGFLIKSKLRGHLTIVLINNNGGGIFEMLPIAQFRDEFEDYFATPQNVDFAKLCATYEVEYKAIATWQQLRALLMDLPNQGIRVLELTCDRFADARWLNNNFHQLTADI